MEKLVQNLSSKSHSTFAIFCCFSQPSCLMLYICSCQNLSGLAKFSFLRGKTPEESHKNVMISVCHLYGFCEFAVVWTSVNGVALQIGQSVRFNCSVSGLPEPEITWYKGNQALQQGGRITKTVSNDSSLFIQQFKHWTWAPPTQDALQRSTVRKMKISPLFALCCVAALCVNTLLGNSCFHFACCITQI